METVEFKRSADSDWEYWPPASTPSPPQSSDVPFRPCYHGKRKCAEWGGVHFFAIRFDGKEWDAANGWHVTNLKGDDHGKAKT